MSERRPRGHVVALVARIGAVNQKDWVLAPGSIEPGALVFISSWDHSVLSKQGSVGMGRLAVVGDDVIFRGRYDVHTERGRDAYQRIRTMGNRIRWSIGFNIFESTREIRDGRDVQVITEAWPIEVSPVLLPAEKQTRTLELDTGPLVGAYPPPRVAALTTGV